MAFMALSIRSIVPSWVTRLLLWEDSPDSPTISTVPDRNHRLAGQLGRKIGQLRQLHTALLLHTYHYLDRSDLTLCQMVCQRWNLLIERHTKHLPIYHFAILSMPGARVGQQMNGEHILAPIGSNTSAAGMQQQQIFDENRFCVGIIGCEWEVSELTHL